MPMIQSLDFGELCITQHSGVITIITLPSAHHTPPVTPHRPGNGDAGKNVSSYQVSSHSDQDNLMALIHLDTMMLSETSCWCPPSLWWHGLYLQFPGRQGLLLLHHAELRPLPRQGFIVYGELGTLAFLGICR